MKSCLSLRYVHTNVVTTRCHTAGNDAVAIDCATGCDEHWCLASISFYVVIDLRQTLWRHTATYLPRLLLLKTYLPCV